MHHLHNGPVLNFSSRVKELFSLGEKKKLYPNYNMAAASRSRVQLVTKKLCFRYQLFFFIIFFLLASQLYIAFSFWSHQQEELRTLEHWKKRVEVLEKVHNSLEVSIFRILILASVI